MDLKGDMDKGKIQNENVNVRWEIKKSWLEIQEFRMVPAQRGWRWAVRGASRLGEGVQGVFIVVLKGRYLGMFCLYTDRNASV